MFPGDVKVSGHAQSTMSSFCVQPTTAYLVQPRPFYILDVDKHLIPESPLKKWFTLSLDTSTLPELQANLLLKFLNSFYLALTIAHTWPIFETQLLNERQYSNIFVLPNLARYDLISTLSDLQRYSTILRLYARMLARPGHHQSMLKAQNLSFCVVWFFCYMRVQESGLIHNGTRI